MTDNHGERLEAALRELRAALEETESLDPELEAPLRAVLGELDGVLDRASDESHGEGAIAGRVEDLALEFEVAHPTISDALNRMTHLLASLGI